MWLCNFLYVLEKAKFADTNSGAMEAGRNIRSVENTIYEHSLISITHSNGLYESPTLFH